MLAVLNLGGAGSVEHDGKLRALGRDLQGVPAAAGFGHGRDLDVIDDGSRAVTTDEDTAVGISIDPELGSDLKVAIGILGDQMSASLVGLKKFILDPPVRFADGSPVVQVGAVE